MRPPFYKDPDFYRRQTLWYILGAVTLVVNRYLLPVGSAVPGGPALTYNELDVLVQSNVQPVLAVLFGVGAIIELYAAADYHGRAQQLSSALAVVVISLAILGVGFFFIVPHPGPWFFIPLLVALFNLLAYFDVKRDLAKLKSLDRLR